MASDNYNTRYKMIIINRLVLRGAFVLLIVISVAIMLATLTLKGRYNLFC